MNRKTNRLLSFILAAVMLLGLVPASGIIASAEGVAHPSTVIIESDGYASGEGGAVRITKSAQWVADRTAEITFDISSLPVYTPPVDFVLIFDTSGSLSAANLAKLKATARYFAELVFESGGQHRFTIIQFAGSAQNLIVQSKDKNQIINAINSISKEGNLTLYSTAIEMMCGLFRVSGGKAGGADKIEIITFSDGGYNDSSSVLMNAQRKFGAWLEAATQTEIHMSTMLTTASTSANNSYGAWSGFFKNRTDIIENTPYYIGKWDGDLIIDAFNTVASETIRKNNEAFSLSDSLNTASGYFDPDSVDAVTVTVDGRQSEGIPLPVFNNTRMSWAMPGLHTGAEVKITFQMKLRDDAPQFDWYPTNTGHSLSYTVGADAEPTVLGTSETPWLPDRYAQIQKEYKLLNAGTVNPAETFYLKQVGSGTTDNPDVTAVPDLERVFGAGANGIDADAVASVPFAQGEATVAGTKRAFVIALPVYERVGVYTYTLREVNNGAVGVTYWATDITLVVSVQNGDDGKIYVAAVHCETPVDVNNANGTKTDTLTNTYSAGGLKINKTVAGNLGDRDRFFNFSVTLTAPGTTTAPVKVTGGSAEDNPTALDFSASAEQTVTFKLKHGETLSFGNLPYGTTFSYEETDADSDGYETEYSDDEQTGAINAAEKLLVTTNTKNGVIDTGVLLDNLPYIAGIAAIVLCGAAFLIVRKRRRAAEEA